MKKKIFTLLLVVSLMVAFTVTSFANFTRGTGFALDQYETKTISFESSEMTVNDGNVNITVDYLSDSNAEYKITVYNVDENRTVFEKTFKGEISSYRVDDIEYNDSHTVTIQNLTDSRLKGNFEIYVW